MTTRVALVGNPNCGKTTLFNLLTGTAQRVGNWPGVTVEKKSGAFSHGADHYTVIDLPGAYNLGRDAGSLDERIVAMFLLDETPDLVVNIVDASALSRSLYLTSQLAELGIPTVIALNMTDVATAEGVEVDVQGLAAELGCPVVPIVASRRAGIDTLLASIGRATPLLAFAEAEDARVRYRKLDDIVERCTQTQPVARTWTQRIDNVVLNPLLAFPIFLGVMYLMFLISINVGSAFIDFFDLLGSALFVELPRSALMGIGLPDWLVVFVADGVGGGVQLVGTFIPVIGALFLVLAVLEGSGYMARVAFIVDRLLRRLKLPGKSFVPLIVGFGCNVPAVMATRALDSQPDRILTTLMAPFMSCGARLTVYALFAAAFFPRNGQNIVFALYLIGVLVAVLSALVVRRHLLPDSRSHFVLEMPAYHMPTLRNILTQAWQRLRGFVVRAGKAIVLVVIALNVLNSIGTDGSVGNQDSEQSVLSAIGKAITPAFAPIGITEDNWPATVGIFTGIFAKEVVVGTLDALYAPDTADDEMAIGDLVTDAFASIPANLQDLAGQLTDPLGLDLGDLGDTASQAEAQEVQINTISAMQNLFDGQLGAFAYLLFVLLYMPCVATIGVIFKEIGAFWAAFSVAWSFVMAYGCAVLAYQLGTLSVHPTESLIAIGVTIGAAWLLFYALIRWGRRHASTQLIPVKAID